MKYPDPDALREYAEEPMPFHDITPGDFEVREGPAFVLDATFETTRYRYRPAYIRVDTDRDTAVFADPTQKDIPIDYESAWEQALDIDVAEDFLCATGCITVAGEAAKYDAFWMLSTVTIRNPDA